MLTARHVLQLIAPVLDLGVRRSTLRSHFRHIECAQSFLRCPSDRVPFFADPVCNTASMLAYFQDARHGRDATKPVYFVTACHGESRASPAIDANCLAANTLFGPSRERCGAGVLWDRYASSVQGVVRPPLSLRIGEADGPALRTTQPVWILPEA